MPHTLTSPSRRQFLTSAAGAGLAGATLRGAHAGAIQGGFAYEVVRSESEWRSMLTDAEYKILREGETEEKFSSPLVKNEEAGEYCCRGCELKIYDQEWQVYPDKGWVFFRHSDPNAVLTSVDGNPYISGVDVREYTLIEVHCRRCGSHFGHVLTVDGETLHCVNGTSLQFHPASA